MSSRPLKFCERQLLEEIDALAPGCDEGAQHDAADRQHDRDDQPQADQPESDDLAGRAELQDVARAPLPPTAAIAARVAQQPTLEPRRAAA